MDPTERSTAAPPSRARLAVLGTGVAVVVAGFLLAIASRNEVPEPPPGPTAINTGATTDLTGIAPAEPETSDGSGG